MARPGPSYRIHNDNRSTYNMIAHDRFGVPDSPLYGMSPRRPAEHRERREENIEAIRDREIKLMRGIIKPDYRLRNDNKSSYDLISGIPTRPVTDDPEFDRLREREMAMAAGYPGGYSPGPGSPIRAYRQIPDSPLYRPGQEHPPVADQGHVKKGQGYDPRNDPPKPSVREPTPERPRSYGKEADMGPPPNQGPPYRDGPEAADSYPEPLHSVEDPAHDTNAMMPGRNLHDMPRTPVYRPGQGKGLTMADPRTGSALKGRMPWDDPNNAEFDTKLRLDDLHRSRDDVKALDEFRDHRGNTVIKGFPPDSYRSGYGLSSDRGFPKPAYSGRHEHAPGDPMYDPRYGGAISTGPGLMGTRNGGALLFIKFNIGRGENIQVASHAFLRAKTHDCGGRYLGMAGRVYEFGYERGPQEAIAVFHFPTKEKALLFFQTDSVLRQPDFPPPYGHAEMWIVCNAYLPDNMQLFNTFLLSEVQLHEGKDRREFFETFQVPFENYLYKNGAMPFVICSYGARDRQDIRRHCYLLNSIVTCHLFQGLDHLNWITNDETYSKFRSLHNQMATERCCIFKLSRDTGL